MTKIPNILAAISNAKYYPSADGLKTFGNDGFAFGFAGKEGPGRQYAVNKQVHEADILEVEANHQNGQVPADGIWTKTKGTTIAVRTADCLPVMLVDRHASMVMAVHAGWRGLCKGILSKAVETFAKQGIPASSLLAAIGPAISRERYEVGSEVITSFFESPMNLPYEISSLCVAKGRGDRWHLDLQTAATANLIMTGIPSEQLSLVQICTWSDNNFHSFRRDGKNAGSNISWITLK
jgi:YfiH family protein